MRAGARSRGAGGVWGRGRRCGRVQAGGGEGGLAQHPCAPPLTKSPCPPPPPSPPTAPHPRCPPRSGRQRGGRQAQPGGADGAVAPQRVARRAHSQRHRWGGRAARGGGARQGAHGASLGPEVPPPTPRIRTRRDPSAPRHSPRQPHPPCLLCSIRRVPQVPYSVPRSSEVLPGPGHTRRRRRQRRQRRRGGRRGGGGRRRVGGDAQQAGVLQSDKAGAAGGAGGVEGACQA